MRRELVGMISALALMAGTAWAEDAATTPKQPPAAANPAAAPAQDNAADAGQGANNGAPAGTMAQQPPASDMAQKPATDQPSTTAQQPPAAPPSTDTAQKPAEQPSTTTAAQPPAQPPAAETAEKPAEPSTTATANAAPEKMGDPVSGNEVIGHEVASMDGKSLGKVNDVILDSASGKIQKLVVSSGGFLGIGAKKVVMPFEDVQMKPEGGIVAVKLSQKDVESLPEYDAKAEVKSLDKTASATTGGGAGPTAPMGSTTGTGTKTQ